jgi:hypothetical protein
MTLIKILDGGMGQYCIDQGLPKSTQLWSAYG